MANRTWSETDELLLKDKFGSSTRDELTRLLPNYTCSAIKAKATKMNLKKDNPRFHFFENQIIEMINLYSFTQNIDLANRFKCSIHTVENKANQLGLKKDLEFIRRTSRDRFTEDHPARQYHFPKGHAPLNKGKKQTEYMSIEAIERTKQTRFKPGQKIWNVKPIGYERIDENGYVYVKVEEPNVFKMKHRLIWEQHYGQIKKGYNIQFKIGIRTDCNLDNLYIISRSDQLKTENSFIAKYPKEMQLAIQAKGALSRQINKQLKQNENEQEQ